MLALLTFVTTRPNEQVSMALAAPNVKKSTLSLENDVYMRKKLYLCTVKRKLYGND